MRLAQWQDAFIDALSQDGSDEAMLSLVNPAQGSRLGIYRNNSLQALTSTLRITFPICFELVGEHCFNLLAKEYIQSNPMLEINLNHYGEKFPLFLEQVIGTSEQFSKVEYLGQMAQLEWLIQLSYYAADSLNCLPIAQIAEVNEQQHKDLLLLLRPDVFILQSGYPLYDIWLTHQQDTHIDIDFSQSEYYFSISRDPYKPLVKQINEHHYCLLHALSKGESLGEMIEQGVEMSSLPEWIAAGWVCGFRMREAK
ncbi:DNA-binding domain-containing protein [Shewanella sp. UCD-KL12]|uniref:HvfC/BufC N-terminal domain-containing protein n=1 Tax=Shewanella sp. UCD-KL12 TaxID=1917163 RepID=UPI0009714264|nr:DNA-binding domain-containing protein [Shewanella sp. UCD-KL12]